MTRGRKNGLTDKEREIIRAGLVASLRNREGRFWAFELEKTFELVHGYTISWGTMLPALRRLEQMGYLTAEWSDPDDGKRPIRYYAPTTACQRLGALNATELQPSAWGGPAEMAEA